jgi:hypothetical protein
MVRFALGIGQEAFLRIRNGVSFSMLRKRTTIRFLQLENKTGAGGARDTTEIGHDSAGGRLT